MPTRFEIDGCGVGSGYPPYIVAELSANHNGKLSNALKIIEAAASAGVNAIKLQTYTPDTLTIDHHSSDFQLVNGPWAGKSLYELYKIAHTPWEWHDSLFRKGRELGLSVFSSPFDQSSVDFLEQFNPPAYKIASFEIVDLPLIEYVSRTGKPLIISTGMASDNEIQAAVDTARTAGCKHICLLHCTSGYPTPPNEMRLREIPRIRDQFDVVVGLSDHTLGTTVPVVAIALGAAIVEKHVTLLRSDGGPDSEFSMEPSELKQLTTEIHVAYSSLETSAKLIQPSEVSQKSMRRSLYAVTDIKAGERFGLNNIRSIRPGYGLPPRELPNIIGKAAARNITRGTPISQSMIIQDN